MALENHTTPETPGWYFKELATELVERRPKLQKLWDRYKGDPPLPDLGNPGADSARRSVWKAFQKKARLNVEALIIGSVLDRLTPIGFRLLEADGPTLLPSAIPRASASLVDGRARRIWTGNDMPIQAGDILEQFLVMGVAYGIVGAPDADEPDMPIITAEDPRNVITAHDPARPSRVLAGLKLFYDDRAQVDVAYLYLPGRVIRAERDGSVGVSVLGQKRFRFNPEQWTVRKDDALPGALAKDVPVRRFLNRDGEGEFEDHLDHLDRINHMILQRIVIATLQAFRQRAIKGIPKTDPKTGAAIDYSDVFTNDPGALWLLPATAELWESGQVDLGPMLSSVKDDIRDLAAVLRLPLYQFMPDAANGSAEGASAQREGLVFRAEDRQTRASTGFAGLMSLAFKYLQDAERSDPLRIETLWRPIERFSLTERAQAAATAVTAGVPWEARMTDFLQYEPDQIALLRRQRADDLLLQPAQPGEPVRGLPATTSGGTRTEFTADTSTPSQPTSAGQTGPTSRAPAA